MDINDVSELLPLLEGRTTTSHGDLVRLRNEALTLLGWYKEIILLEGRPSWQIKSEAEAELEARILAVIDSANRGIRQFLPKPRLCTNATQ